MRYFTGRTMLFLGSLFKSARRPWTLDPNAHRARPFRVHQLASDFTLLDTWTLPVLGEPDAFPDFLRFMASIDPAGSRLASWLFRLRFWLGQVFGWDAGAPLPIPGCRETSVRERLTPEDLARHVPGAWTPNALDRAAPNVVYRFEDEALLEITNRTVHALLHLGWVDAGAGKKRPELAVYVKTRGRRSRFYLALIAPFRHLVVYPAWMSKIEREWPRFTATRRATSASGAPLQASPTRT